MEKPSNCAKMNGKNVIGLITSLFKNWLANRKAKKYLGDEAHEALTCVGYCKSRGYVTQRQGCGYVWITIEKEKVLDEDNLQKD